MGGASAPRRRGRLESGVERSKRARFCTPSVFVRPESNMSWVELKERDVACETLCACADCDLPLLVQDVEAVVRAGEPFRYRTSSGMQVSTAPERVVRLAAAPDSTTALDLPPAREAPRTHTCDRTPETIRCDGETYRNARPVLKVLVPFTRLEGCAVCLGCRQRRRRARAFFEVWRVGI